MIIDAGLQHEDTHITAAMRPVTIITFKVDFPLFDCLLENCYHANENSFAMKTAVLINEFCGKKFVYMHRVRDRKVVLFHLPITYTSGFYVG
ncbi:hypothetical protein HanPI659440_Chr12g0453401 [Helianthus annuus]|nr:hypothetical protein HanPI659440_Chr12g0453401 [Helianthus annuus]